MSADIRSNVQASDAAGVAGRAPRAIAATLSLLAGVVALLALAPLAQALPAGRGYEKVSPADKDGQDILNGLDMAGLDGNSAAYISFGAFGDSEGGGLVTSFRSVRTATDWATVSVGPAQIPTPGLATSLFQDYSADTSSAIVGYLNGDPGFDGATPGTSNLYRRDLDGSMHLLTKNQPVVPPGGFPPSPNSSGSSNDLGITSFTFNTTPALQVTTGPDAIDGIDNAFSSDGDDLRLVSVLPNGDASPQGGVIGQSGFSPGYNVVSDNGSRIFWTTSFGADPTEVYVRVNGTSTRKVSVDQRTTPDPIGVLPKTYQYATPDGDFAYFSSDQKLTNNSQAEPGASDLYRYEFATGDVVDLTTGDPDGAGIQGVIGVNDSGSRVYFAAAGVLDAGATDGATNLYVRDGSQTNFIATLNPFEAENWSTQGSSKTGRVTSSGGRMLFGTRSPQLGYDNATFFEFYVYDLASDSFECVSCNPSGAPATGDAVLGQPQVGGLALSGLNLYERRNLTADGSTAFFTSPERLVNSDTNGVYDAYMWSDGDFELVSTGQSPGVSAFVDASADGNDAFFLTREQLVGVDTDNQVDLYDARVGGGLASQNPPPPPPPCTGDTCKPAPTSQTGPPNSGTADVTGTEPPGAGPDCSSFEQKATKSAAKAKQKKQKVKQLKKKGAPKKKIKKAKQKSKQAKQAAKEAKQAANECNNA